MECNARAMQGIDAVHVSGGLAEAIITGVLRRLLHITQSRQLLGRYLPCEEMLTIEAGKREKRVFELRKGMALDWRWHLEQMACDVGFSARAMGVAGSLLDVGEVSIVAPGSTFSNGKIIRGQWACQDTSTGAEWYVILSFDNTHSKFRSKTIKLRTHIKVTNLEKGAVGQRLQVQASRRSRREQTQEDVSS
jgi:hypothetical protein